MSIPGKADTFFQSSGYEIEIYTNWPDCDYLKEEWNSLVVGSPHPNVFMTWEWTQIWWKWFGVRDCLRLIVVRDDLGIVVILPLHIQQSAFSPGFKLNILCLVGDGGSVYPDFLGPITGQRATMAAFNVLGSVIISLAGSWQAFRFADVQLESPGVGELISVLKRSFSMTVNKGESCPFLPLPSKYESFLSSLSASQRESIRRRLRKAKKRYSFRLEYFTTFEKITAGIDDLLIVFSKSNRGIHLDRGFNRSDYTGFHADLIRSFSQQGWLRLIVLYFDDVPVAFLYGYKFEDIFFFYQTGYDLNYKRDGAGSIVLQAAIERAITERCVYFEFLRGDEAYKYHFSKGETQSSCVIFWKNRGLGWIIYFGLGIIKKFVRIFK